MARATFRIEGMKELQKALKKLGAVPQKHVTSSARKGMNIALKDSKANAPFDTGMLKKGMKLKGERSKYKGKKVYQVIFDSAMNDVFQKPIKNPGEAGGKNNTGYYPFSQEYGYFARNGRYIPGYRFIHDSLSDNTQKISKTMVSEMKKKIDAEIASLGLR